VTRTMILRAFIAIVAADAIDRQRREQQRRAWAAAEEARAADAGAILPALASGNFDPLRPERPT
jgi:hypothetical protein